ncbi:MAG: hypothetical protein L3J96_07300, partial [Thermoplasmata archaeon]|nr:hypothetical protein [Thermoplasmata archaeon]
SCFLLGFSIAPFLSAFFDGLLGLAPDVPHGVLGISPARPLPWGPMRVLGLPLGSGRVDLELQEDGVTGKWSGPGPLVLAGPRSSVRLTPGVAAQLPGAAVGQLV